MENKLKLSTIINKYPELIEHYDIIKHYNTHFYYIYSEYNNIHVSLYEYALRYGTSKDAEQIFMKIPKWACRYAENIIEDRWPEAESYIMQDAKWAYWYTSDVIEQRWPEAELYIMKDEFWAYTYARDVIKGRWPEAEPYIMKDPDNVLNYIEFLLDHKFVNIDQIKIIIE